MKNFNLKDLEKAVLFGLIFSVLISFAKFDTACEDLRKNILRLHIIADSDRKEDQEVKLKVRDAVLKAGEDIFKNCTTLKETENQAEKNKTLFKQTADRVLSENGFDYSSKTEINNTDFETRVYDDFTLPAGNYKSLTVTLGSGKGHNWWCVIYPSVCLGSSSKKLKCVGKSGFEIATKPEKYTYKLKVIEVYEKIKRSLKKR